MTTAEMRIPSRPPVVGQAAAMLWSAAGLFAVAGAVKSTVFGTFNEVGKDAQFRVANMHNFDPDLLEYVPFYLGFAAFMVILCYASSVLWHSPPGASPAAGPAPLPRRCPPR